MDTLRGSFGSFAEGGSDDHADLDVGHDVPPASIGQDERRMQVRAYNHWASLLGDRNFPAIEDLEPDNLPDFGPHGVLLDFTAGIENPGVAYLGAKLAEECGVEGAELETLAEVPPRSLLTRITDHYMQILANQAPIGFEAEFVNQRGVGIAYRGILLPFSTDDDTIDFIYGVINWKELADAQTADELLLEIDQALDPSPAAQREEETPLTDWADGPGAVPANDIADAPESEEPADIAASASNVLPMPSFGYDEEEPEAGDEDPFAAFGLGEGEDEEAEDPPVDLDDEEEEQGSGPSYGSLLKMPLDLGRSVEKGAMALPELDPAEMSLSEFEAEEMRLAEADAETAPMPTFEAAPPEFEAEVTDFAAEAPEFEDTDANFEAAVPPSESPVPEFESAAPAFEPVSEFEAEAAPVELAITLSELDPADMGLGDWLAEARELAAAAHNSEDRTRNALYGAIGRAYDFSLAAAEAPEEFHDLLADAELTVQDRAPMTPVVKLVFGADYDKTRLTEYAAALSHAHRLSLPLGTLGEFLAGHDGGLKGVVKAERRLRKEEAGKTVEPLDAPRHALARKLRAMPVLGFDSIAAEGSEFALVMVRRTEAGEVAVLGEVPEDIALIERAARRLIG